MIIDVALYMLILQRNPATDCRKITLSDLPVCVSYLLHTCKPTDQKILDSYMYITSGFDEGI